MFYNSLKMSGVMTKLVISFVAVVILTTSSQVSANEDVKNPVVVEGHQAGNVQPLLGPATEGPKNTSAIKPELRVSSLASEVIQLLEEDETKSNLNQSSKHPGSGLIESSKMDCSKVTMQIFQVLLQNPDTVEPEDYSCGLLNLISQFEKYNVRIRSLEASLHTATTTIHGLETSLHTEMSKTEFLIKELNETMNKESERAIKAENVIARRVLSEKSRVDTIQKNLTEYLNSAMDQVKEFETILRKMDEGPSRSKEASVHSSLLASLASQSSSNSNSGMSDSTTEEFQKIEGRISSMQELIKELTTRIGNIEEGSDEHANKGITQIFKTYASLANEIEKETERATGEEKSLKTLITNEISGLSKQIINLQERITEEKNRVQVIENRRTADLFEEINRAKSEEARLGQKLKDEMSKAAAAFKRLELHVDVQLNSSRPVDDDFKLFAENITRRYMDVEEKCIEQVSFERTRAQSVENSLKSHLETEVTRAMTAENDLKKMATDEKERARTAEHELKVAIDVETYRAKGVEISISAQVVAETERAKEEEFQLREFITANTTRLLTDIIQEFTRAQSVENELNEKIINEVNRAMNAEQGLMSNINLETNRASDKEKELHNFMKSQENSVKSFDKIVHQVEIETNRAQQAELTLEKKITAEVTRAKTNEDIIVSRVQEELLRFKTVELNLTQTSSDVLRHTKELELEVRKTVMAEVARAVDAENSIKQQIHSEMSRAIEAEITLSHYQASNYTQISGRLQELVRDSEKDSLRLEDISLQISRNLTGDILTLAELFDDKLDDLERSENVRLKRLEEDMKKCCTSSSWRWRSPKTNGGKNSSSSEGPFSRILQIFGAFTEDDDSESRKSTAKKIESYAKESSRAIKGTSERNKVDSRTKPETHLTKDTYIKESRKKQNTSALTTQKFPEEHDALHNNVTIIYPENVDQSNTNFRRTKPIRRNNRRFKSIYNNNNTIINDSDNEAYSIHTAQSRVRNTFG